MRFPSKDDDGRPVDKLSPVMSCRWHPYGDRQYLAMNGHGAIVCPVCDFPDTTNVEDASE